MGHYTLIELTTETGRRRRLRPSKLIDAGKIYDLPDGDALISCCGQKNELVGGPRDEDRARCSHFHRIQLPSFIFRVSDANMKEVREEKSDDCLVIP